MPSLIPRTKSVHAPSPKTKSKQNLRKPSKGKRYQPTPTAFVSSNMSAMDAMTATNDKYQTFPIIWDTGASYTITPDKADFLNYSSTPSIKAMQGFGKDSKEKVHGDGEVLWYIEDESGTLQALKMKALHIPTSPHRLLSTHALCSQHPDLTMSVASKGATVKVHPSAISIYAPVNKKSNLIVSMGHRYGASPVSFCAISDVPSAYPATPATVSDANMNLSDAAKELLRWHQRLGHVSFARVQHLLRSGVLAKSESARRLHRSAASIAIPKCPACVFAKQRRRSSPGSTSTVVQDRVGALRKDNLSPGQEVSVDHFVCLQKGCLFTSRDKETTTDKYCRLHLCGSCLQLHPCRISAGPYISCHFGS